MAKGMIRRLLLPQEDKFYPMFEDLAELISKASHILARVIESTEPWKEEDPIREIKLLENKADEIVHRVMDALDSSFITPFDREDIHRLVSRMDDVMDNINSTAQQILLYRPGRLAPQIRELTMVAVRGCEQIRIAVMELRNLQKRVKINEACIKINELENVADDIFHKMISDLFAFETDAIELIKNKEIMETLEYTTDRIEDVSDILKTILIKNS
jgi:predicted phosphate transport protein (TIGR00153 family)